MTIQLRSKAQQAADTAADSAPVVSAWAVRVRALKQKITTTHVLKSRL